MTFLPTTEHLDELARRLGAASVGVCDAGVFETERHRIVEAIRSERAGPLHFTYSDPIVATDVRLSFPWAQRVLVVARAYLPASPPTGPDGAMVARFATVDQYRPLREITDAVARELRASGFEAEVLIDDSRLMDRAAAVRSGVGWWGWSTMVLAPGHGPWMILGCVVTDAPLAPTPPMTRGCGTCRACLPACPTGALSTVDGLDARRCLATWLQTPGSIPQWIRPHLGARVYGCDECLTSCPPGRRAPADGPPPEEWSFSELLAMDDDSLIARVPWWYVPRRDGRFLRRNLLVAAGNGGDPALRTTIEEHLSHPSSMIRGHAAWALARLLGPGAGEALRSRLTEETVVEATDELILALLAVEHPTASAVLLAADEWVATTPGLEGLALLGSHATANGTPTSDLDLLVLTTQPEQVVPPAALGAPARGHPVRLGRALGHRTSGRVPVDLVVGPLDWPTDEGGARALTAGIVAVGDRSRRVESIRRREKASR